MTDDEGDTSDELGEERATETATTRVEHHRVENVVVWKVGNHVLDIAEIEVGVGFAEPDGRVVDKDSAVAEMDAEVKGEDKK